MSYLSNNLFVFSDIYRVSEAANSNSNTGVSESFVNI